VIKLKSGVLIERKKPSEMEQERQKQLQKALARSDAEEALAQIVLAWKASGMKQQAILDEFEEYRRVLRERDEEEKEDRLMDVMDRIAGWCSPHTQLF